MKSKQDIHDFVQGLLDRSGDCRSFADADSLFLSGRLQSVDAVEIVIFLEENFGIDFAEIGFDQQQIDSVNAIQALAQRASIR